MVSFGPIGPSARVFPVSLCKIKDFLEPSVFPEAEFMNVQFR
jgi:hypothetical protein